MSLSASDIKVYGRAAWADAWTLLPHVYCNRLIECAAPEVSVAELTYDYGMIMRRGESTFAAESPKDLLNTYVRICDKSDGTGQLDWVGVVTCDARDSGGDVLGQPSGAQTFTARGLEHLLDRAMIQGAWAESPFDGSPAWIGHCPPFNRRPSKRASVLGNRSAAKLSGIFGDTWAFSSAGSVWTHADALEYLLGTYAPSNIPWIFTGNYDDFTGVDLVMDASGMSVKAALDVLFDRRRGYGWAVRYFSAANAAWVAVFSLLSSDIAEGGVIFSANVEQSSLSVKGRRDVDRCIVREEAESHYDRVRVVGGRVKSCFSVSCANGTLEPAWTPANQAAYLAGLSSTPGGYGSLAEFEKAEANDQLRKSQGMNRVFSLFRLPPDWAGDCGAGPVASYDAIPKVDDDGSLLYSPGRRGMLQRPILDFTPFPEGADATADLLPSDADPRCLGPLVFAKTAQGKYFNVEKPPADEDLPSASVASVDREMALRVRFEAAPHVLARNHWTGAEPSDVEPEFD
ncbi:MAG TPA: hypothetical protein P5137_00990, partial [Candidatus Brocadiia bacterium]|nr:hypothetical protein [Candidatus Brocadiia bacterium]